MYQMAGTTWALCGVTSQRLLAVVGVMSYTPLHVMHEYDMLRASCLIHDITLLAQWVQLGKGPKLIRKTHASVQKCKWIDER